MIWTFKILLIRIEKSRNCRFTKSEKNGISSIITGISLIEEAIEQERLILLPEMIELDYSAHNLESLESLGSAHTHSSFCVKVLDY